MALAEQSCSVDHAAKFGVYHMLVHTHTHSAKGIILLVSQHLTTIILVNQHGHANMVNFNPSCSFEGSKDMGLFVG